MPTSPSASSPQPQQDSASNPTAPLPGHLTWTPAHEARLVYVQRQLTAAQAAWSEEQDLWIDEVVRLEELKRKCVKAGKKVAAMGGGGGGGGGARGRKGSGFGGMLLKRGSWAAKSKTASSPIDVPSGGEGSPTLAEADVGGEGPLEDEDDETGTETRTSSRRASISNLLRRTMSLGAKDPEVGSSRRNTVDGEQPLRPTLTRSSYSSYSTADGPKGKGRLLLKRRGSGR